MYILVKIELAFFFSVETAIGKHRFGRYHVRQMIFFSQNWLGTVYLDTKSVGLVYLGRKSNRKRASQLPIIILRAGNHHAPVRYICRIDIWQISRKYGTPISEMVEKKRECKIGRCCTIIIRRATSQGVQSQICANQAYIQSYM